MMAEDSRTITNPVTREHVTFLETSAETRGARAVLQVTLAPGGAVQAHSHRQTETFECTNGRVDVVVDGHTVRLEPGDEAIAAADQIHALRNETDDPATVLVTVTPAGDIERGLRAVFALTRAGHLTAGKPPKNPLVMARLVVPDHVYLPPLPRPLYWALMHAMSALGGQRADRAINRWAGPPPGQ